MRAFPTTATPNAKGGIEELIYFQPFPQSPVATLFTPMEKTRINQRRQALPMQKLPSDARIAVINDFSMGKRERSERTVEKSLITTQFLHSQSYYGYY